MESAPLQLKPFLKALFTDAKKALRDSEWLGLGIGVLALLTVFLPEGWGRLAWGGGVLSLVLLVLQQVQGYRFRHLYANAEEIRRQFLLSDGLGSKLSQPEISRLILRHGQLEDDGEPYYTSRFPAGPKRLLMLTWESAFWSEHLQAVFVKRLLLKAAGTSAIAVVALLFSLYGPEGPVVAKVIPPAMALIVGLNFWGKWVESREVHKACERTCADCEIRVNGNADSESREDEVRDVMQVVLSYSATMLTAYPTPDELYEQMKPRLDAEWDKVEKWAAESDWGRRALGELA